MASYDVVIVGAGHGGAQTAIALRQRGFRASIAIVGEECDVPYERPPLSKGYLAGEKAFDRIQIRPPAFWGERDVALLTGRRVVSVDLRSQVVATQTGETIGYGQLVWAAGGHARRLTCAGHDLAGVHSVRSRADVDAVVQELETTRRVVVVGGGYIGLEVAAVLSGMGKTVTVLEAQDRVLARVAGVALSRFYQAEHRTRGVDVRLGTVVESIVGDGAGRAAGVRLSSGELVSADMVIVGIGIVPAIEPLMSAGAQGGNGVAVDEHCRTSLPGIFALGDCALHANPYAEGMPIRLESVQNAHDMAATVAGAITGHETAYHAVPWFWSNQYDLRLQTVGLSTGHDIEILRGSPSSRSFSIIYLKQGRVMALDCINATRDYVQGKALIECRAVIEPGHLADGKRPLKDLTASS